MTTRTPKTIRFATALAATLGAFAFAAPLAQAAAGGSEACTQSAQSPYPGWVNVIDEQGVPTLFPVGFAPSDQHNCTNSTNQPALTSAGQDSASSTGGSPYPGWVTVIDEQGVPWLYPIFKIFE